MLVWKKSNKHYCTPGGDPVWECPNCGFEHVYGVENANRPKHECPNCKNKIRYEWEENNE